VKPTKGEAEGCIVIHPALKSAGKAVGDPVSRLEEACGLARAIGLDVRHAEILGLERSSPATLLGKGQVARLAAIVKEGNFGVAVVDSGLTPIQQRNLERLWECKVIDRTGLILEIFGERARTAEGRLQVDLAALTFQRSRLVRSWTHLERQRGGAGFMGGPGERQIETDRRLIGRRIGKLKKELAEVRRTRALHRKARGKVPYPVAALVGYTNAGKSTLFNRLTGACVAVRDQIFVTLDPTMREVVLPSGRRLILSDTVGFISGLPHELVEAFQATLEEVMEADVVIHVRDCAAPATEAQKADVLAVLGDIGLKGGERTIIEVLNKIDRLPAADREALESRAARPASGCVAISARGGQGCERLLAALDEHLARTGETLRLEIDPGDGALLSWLYEHGEVLARKDSAEAICLSVRLDAADAGRLRRKIKAL
jgi:GTP-binding protein HflX